MAIIEQYSEIIEKKHIVAQMFWKNAILLCYLSSAVTGYIATILFARLWLDICGNHCPIWAEMRISSKFKYENLNDLMNVTNGINQEMRLRDTKWTEDVFVIFPTSYQCNLFLIINACSCIFGITWFIVFFICDREAINTNTLLHSWKMVFPALIFSIVFVIPCIIIAYLFERGYNDFSLNLFNISSVILKSRNSLLLERECEAVSDMFQHLNYRNYDICSHAEGSRITTYIMITSWFTSIIILLLRFLLVVDFDVYKITIHSIPTDITPEELVKKIKNVPRHY